MSDLHHQDSDATLSRWLNLAALLAICASLTMAFIWQVVYNELPCPLCQLQRVALILVGVGLMLNLRFGPAAVHYSIILASALGGAVASARQDLLHIVPGDKGYGTALFGLHFYTWAFISFVVVMIFCAVMISIDRNRLRASNQVVRSGVVAVALIWFFLAISAANTVNSLMICKLGPCPENPTVYLWKF